jgi:ribosome-binding factor A
MDPHRTERVAEALREEISELISYEMSDPRVSSAVVTQVHVSPDLKHAQVQVDFSSDAEIQPGIAALEGARGYLRRELARRLELYRVPELNFEPAIAAQPGSRMDHLLKRIRRGRPRSGGA